MSRTLLIFLVVAAVFAVSSAQRCGENEEYTTCGTACEPVCGQPQRICTFQCKIGCQCREGYMRNAQNKCVHSTRC